MHEQAESQSPALLTPLQMKRVAVQSRALLQPPRQASLQTLVWMLPRRQEHQRHHDQKRRLTALTACQHHCHDPVEPAAPPLHCRRRRRLRPLDCRQTAASTPLPHEPFELGCLIVSVTATAPLTTAARESCPLCTPCPAAAVPVELQSVAAVPRHDAQARQNLRRQPERQMTAHVSDTGQ
jgi:hypothetical protein